MEVQAEHDEDTGEHGRTIGANRPTYDECRTINVILKPLELPNRGDESLHRVINSPTDSKSSSGSWNLTRRLYEIIGAPAEVDPEAKQGDAVHQQAAEAERLHREEEDRRALAVKGQLVHEEILQTKMGDQNVFIMPQQNIIAAKALFDSVEPMMAEDHAATPVLTRIKAMVTASAIQHYEEGNWAFTPQLRRAVWPSNFSPKGIKTYDGDRDPETWLRVYTTVIKAAGGNQNTMANYLPVVLSPTVQDWLTELPANSINSWGYLCARFISNFQGTFTKPGVEWVLYQITQKKDESLWEFIRRFIKKKNSIANVSNAVIMAT